MANQQSKNLNALILPLVTARFKRPVTLDYVQAFAKTLLKKGVADEILVHWVNGEQITPMPDIFGPWCELKWNPDGIPEFVVNRVLLKQHREAAAKTWFD